MLLTQQALIVGFLLGVGASALALICWGQFKTTRLFRRLYSRIKYGPILTFKRVSKEEEAVFDEEREEAHFRYISTNQR